MAHYITLEKRLTRLRISVAGGIILWTLLLAGLLAWNIHLTKQETRELAKKEAQSTFNKDQAFRLWATKHGGVYVPATEETPPNPYLSNIPERDIQLPSGKRLTLMNPAYMLRQTMEEYDELYGVKGHITSLNLLNPTNKPDEWEQKALKAFEKGEKEVFEFTLLEGRPYLRLMQPMVVKEGCLKCHKEQGYKVGDIRGGVGVSVPMAGYFALEEKTINAIIFPHVLIWLLGMTGIGIVFAKGKKSIIEQEEAHKNIMESEEFLNSIVENIPDMIFVKDAKELRFIKFNKAGEEMLGYKREELYGKNDHDFFPHEEAEFFTGKDRVVLNSKQLLDIPEETIKTHYKGNRILHTKKIPIADADGNPKFLLGISEDITERKCLEEAVKVQTKRFEVFFDNAITPLAFLDRDFNFIRVNKSYAESAQREISDFLGRNHFELYPSDAKAIFEDVVRTKTTFQTFGRPFKYADHPEWGVTYWDWSLVPILDNKGEVEFLVFSLVDVTKQMKVEQERERLTSELLMKTKELEQILYAASHDLKTPLVNINGYSGELKYSIDKLLRNMEKEAVSSEAREEIASLTKELPESFNFISSSVSRMDSLLNGLLEFSRSGRIDIKNEEIDMNILIKEIRDSINHTLKDKGASIEVTDLQACRGDRDNLSRVFSNLIENAVKYLDPARKGKITVTGYKEENQSVYCVEDNGIGIASEHQKQIFHIFHKLDPDMTGEGLGLAIVQRIVERHGGRIWLESEAGKGSKFCVALPWKA